MKRITAYISWAIMFLQLNRALAKDGKDLHGNILCLSAGIHAMLKDRKVTNEEVDMLSGCVADTAASLINLITNFTLPEEEPAPEVDII